MQSGLILSNTVPIELTSSDLILSLNSAGGYPKFINSLN